MNTRNDSRFPSQPMSSRRIRGPEAVVCLLVLMFASSGCLSIIGLRAACDPDEAILAPSPSQAIETTDQQVSDDKSRAESKVMVRAARLYRNGNLKAARQLLQTARKKNPHLRDALQMEADLALDSGDQNDYIELLHAIIEAYPESAQIQNAVGNLLVHRRPNPESAENRVTGIKALQRAVELEPHTSRYARDLAAGYVANSDFASAKKTLIDALYRIPADEPLPFSLARLAEVTGDWESAVSYYNLGIRRNQNAARWRQTRAHCLYRMGDYQQARQEYGVCYRNEPQDFSLVEYVEFGDACLRVGDYAIAQKAFDAISHDGGVRLKEVELLRGLCAWHQGQSAQARGILAAALTYWPHDAILLDVQQMCRAKSGPLETSPLVPEQLPETASIHPASIVP